MGLYDDVLLLLLLRLLLLLLLLLLCDEFQRKLEEDGKSGSTVSCSEQ